MTTAHTSAGTLEKPLRYTLPAMLVFVISSILAAIGWARHTELESRLWITALFVAPWFLQLFSLCILRSRTTPAFWWFNAGATFICQASNWFLWIIYFTQWKASQKWSYIALILAFAMLGCVAVMTFAIMRKPEAPSSDEDAPQNVPSLDVPYSNGTEGLVRQWRKFATRWEAFSQNLSEGIGGHRFWAITYFMALFLGVSYLFGFALGFHDQYIRVKTINEKPANEKPALYMVNLKSDDDVSADSTADQHQHGNKSTEPADDQSVKDTTTQTVMPAVSASNEEFCFYFEELKANLGQSKEGCPEGIPNPKRMDLHPQISLFNSCSLRAIVDTLQETTKKGGRVKVSLLSHTDNEPIKVPGTTSVRYLSNYELSESRAHHVRYEILRLLRDRHVRDLENIDWVFFPAADEALPQINRGAITKDHFPLAELTRMGVVPNSDKKDFSRQVEKYLSTEDIDHRLPPQEKRVVIATIEAVSQSPVILQPEQMRNLMAGQDKANDKLKVLETAQNEHISQSQSKPLRLMDYMYFSIYTITTTGYGDIVPTTAYAKFVTSAANIFEVIFLVVFFNALISLQTRPDHEGLDAVRSLPKATKKQNSKDGGQGTVRAFESHGSKRRDL